MGLIDAFKKKREEADSRLIDALYTRADQLNDDQLMQILKEVFLEFGKNALSMILMRSAVETINKSLNCLTVPQNVVELRHWIENELSKANIELKRSIFVSLAREIHRANVITDAALMQKVDDLIKAVRK